MVSSIENLSSCLGAFVFVPVFHQRGVQQAAVMIEVHWFVLPFAVQAWIGTTVFVGRLFGHAIEKL